jgi:hypothetical protein
MALWRGLPQAEADCYVLGVLKPKEQKILQIIKSDLFSTQMKAGNEIQP